MISGEMSDSWRKESGFDAEKGLFISATGLSARVGKSVSKEGSCGKEGKRKGRRVTREENGQ